MMTGSTIDHDGDCYRVRDIKSNGTQETRDVTWMRHMYYKHDIGQDIALPLMTKPGIDDPHPCNPHY
jgi:hypothetical protein